MDLTTTTEQTLDAIKKATSGVTSSTGIYGIDLSGLISLIPVVSPFRDALPRTTPKQGGQYAMWRALVDVTNTQPNPSVAFDQAASLALVSEQDVTALYKKIGMGYTVSVDSIDQAQGYADLKAVAIMNALGQYKIGEDKLLIGGQNFALAQPTAPTLTASTTGGSIAASTAVPVTVAARSHSNYFWGGSTAAPANASVNTGAGTATNSVTATTPAVKGAAAYDWYVNNFYYTTTTVNTVTITSIPTANAAAPSLPDLYATAPSAVPAADTSYNSNNFNGLVATLVGDYATGGATGLVKNGTGTTSGAYFKSLDGAALTSSGQSITELDNMFQSLFDKVRLSPSALMVSSQQGTEISKLLLANGAANTYFTPGLDGRTDVAAGGFVSHYVNKAAGGVPVPIEVHPHLAPGTIIARTDRVPFPNSNITNTLEVRCLRDVADYEYAASRGTGAGGGPRFDGETYSVETLVNRAPVAMGVLSNVA